MRKGLAVTKAVVVSGAGRYSDPWHPFAETSEALARILAEEGLHAHVAENVDETLANTRAFDLVLVNIGAPQWGDPAADAAVRLGVLEHLHAGKPLMSHHVSVTSLPTFPEWEAITGATWVRGTTMHPEYGWAHISVHAERHPIVGGLSDFDIQDERYAHLRVSPTVFPVLTHHYEGTDQALLWPRTYRGARIVYDALGHDRRSYESTEHRTILRRAVCWLLDESS
jgi:type 1 glutamine amidotransferase